MPVKEWFRQMQPVQLYIILILTIAFFITELIVSHITHALTLLMDSYHMLCNILALTGCIITIKYGKNSSQTNCDLTKAPSKTSEVGEELTSNPCHDKKNTKSSVSRASQEKKLKNTFGWARIDVISMLICFVFMASFCFSIFVEAIQTLVHIDHQDEMHHPISVLCIGSAGILLNGLCYLLIGGYTFHQGSFLYVTESGDVILNKVMVGDSVRRGERRLSRTRNVTPSPPRQRQGFREMCRDVLGCVVVIVCALLIYFITDKQVAKYIDPILSLVSAASMLILSYPYMKESALILLQTMPDTINIDSLKADLLEHFPDVVNVHDFHVWQLTASKIISTVHIIFQNPKVYNKIMNDVKEFFIENGITQVTIQPEFYTHASSSIESLDSLMKVPPLCLMACQGEACKESHCCPSYENLSSTKFKSHSKEEIPGQTPLNLKSIKVINPDSCIQNSRSIGSTVSLENVPTSNKELSKSMTRSDSHLSRQTTEEIKL